MGHDAVDPTSTVFIVDGDISARESLELLIRTAGWQTKTFASAEKFLSHPDDASPCCIVLEMMLPGVSGLELQKQVAGRQHMPLIFITGHTDVPKAVQAIKLGAFEFLTKPFKDEALLHAIGAAVKRSEAALRDDADMQRLRHRYASLTNRECEVMALIVAGLLNKQAAWELGITEITVKAHRGHLMRKMEADSLAHLVRMATRLGLTAARHHTISRRSPTWIGAMAS